MPAIVSLLIALAIFVVARPARADGWVDCNGPDKSGKCNANGADAGAGLLMLAGVTFAIGRRRKRR